MNLDRWDVIAIAGAGLLGGGVWGLAGPAWACVAWGSLLLGAANLQAFMAARKGKGRG